MKNFSNNFISKKLLLACIACCTFTFSGCSNKMNNQSASDADQSTAEPVAAETDTQASTPVPVATVTRYTYIQPIDLPQDDSTNLGKVTIDAGETSFKQLDKNNNEIVDKDEFYDGLFELLDADGDNVISDKEFRLEDIFLSTNPDSELNKLATWDANGNDEITKEELTNKMASIIDVPDGQTLAQNLYIVWDTDNDDKIEKLELDKVIITYDSDDNDTK